MESGELSPNLLARGLRAGGTGLAGIVLPDPESFYLAGKLGLLAKELTGRGFEPIFRVTDGSAGAERAALGMFAAVRCAVVVIFAARLGAGDAVICGLLARGTRILHVDPVTTGLKLSAISVDRAAAMRLSIGHLHACGHRSAVIAGIAPEGVYGAIRWRGIRTAARKHAWPEPARLDAPEAGDEFEEGARIATAFFNQKPRARAVIARNDRLAMGFLARARTLGLHCPQDFSIIGYDNTPLAAHTEPPLTTIDPNHSQLITEATTLLDTSGHPNTKITIRPKLVKRESTAHPAQWEQSSPRERLRPRCQTTQNAKHQK
jgi:DNA-binding LacI/PurR family transcriptional regulator